MTDHEIKEVFAEAVAVFSDGFQAHDLIAIGGIIMRIVQMKEDFKGKGSLKKKIVLLVFEKIIVETGLFREAQAVEATKFLVGSLPTLIDEIKSISRTLAQKTSRWCCCT